MRFTWDPKKARKVFKDHGIKFTRIIDVFSDSLSLDLIDNKHSSPGEERFIIIGVTAVYGLIHLVYTLPNEDEIHFVTARKADSWDTRQYEENVRGT